VSSSSAPLGRLASGRSHAANRRSCDDLARLAHPEHGARYSNARQPVVRAQCEAPERPREWRHVEDEHLQRERPPDRAPQPAVGGRASERRSTLPALGRSANRHRAVGLTNEQRRYTFTNTLPDAEARALYGRYHVPASGEILWDSVLANFESGPQATWVDYGNAARPALLFIAGGAPVPLRGSTRGSSVRHRSQYGPVRKEPPK